MYTSSAISKIRLFDMSYPRVSCVWVCKTGIMIVNRDHLGILFYAKAFASLVFPSRDESDDQAI